MTVGFVTSDELIELTCQLPKIERRSKLVADLIDSFELLGKMEIIDPIDICGLQLAEFHSKDYISVLENYNDNTPDEEKLKQFGLEFDCPPFPKMFRTVCAIGGASLSAVDELGQGYLRIVINWFGGWHHGQPEKAAGYCYLNDCVLAIRHLRNYFSRVLYIDIDLHHGNGVEAAFYQTNSVLTYSIHKYESGFYPGSGGLECIGEGKGRGYSVNIPLKDGASDQTLKEVVEGTLDTVVARFKPDAIVCQCGADGISGDPHQAFSYTPEGLASVVKKVVNYRKPTLLLGGGGYNHPNVARTWTIITADILETDLSKAEVPDHINFTEYGPGFDMAVKPSYKRNENDIQYLCHVINTVNKNLDLIK